jgi:DNA-binding XRE family transcriptional regulator
MVQRREDMPAVRHRIREARITAGYSVQKLADEVRLSARGLEFIEAGSQPAVGVALRIAAVFGVTVESLFSLEDPHWRSRPVAPVPIPGPGEDPGPVSEEMRAALVAAYQHPKGHLPADTPRRVAAALYAAGLAEARRGQKRKLTLAGRVWLWMENV